MGGWVGFASCTEYPRMLPMAVSQLIRGRPDLSSFYFHEGTQRTVFGNPSHPPKRVLRKCQFIAASYQNLNALKTTFYKRTLCMQS